MRQYSQARDFIVLVIFVRNVSTAIIMIFCIGVLCKNCIQDLLAFYVRIVYKI